MNSLDFVVWKMEIIFSYSSDLINGIIVRRDWMMSILHNKWGFYRVLEGTTERFTLFKYGNYSVFKLVILSVTTCNRSFSELIFSLASIEFCIVVFPIFAQIFIGIRVTCCSISCAHGIIVASFQEYWSSQFFDWIKIIINNIGRTRYIIWCRRSLFSLIFQSL